MMTRAVAKLNISWPAEEHAEPQTSKLDERFLRAKRSPPTRSLPFFPDLHTEVSRSWASPFSAHLFVPSSDYYGNVGGLKQRGYRAMPQIEQTLASYLSPIAASSLKAPSLPSKLLRTTSALVGKGYTAADQAGACLHTMSVLQAYQADLMKEMDEREAMSPDDILELRKTADLALRATKETARAIGRSMAAMVAAERHLWLTLSDIKDKDRVFLLDRHREARRQAGAFQRFLPHRPPAQAAAGREQPQPRASSSYREAQRQSGALPRGLLSLLSTGWGVVMSGHPARGLWSGRHLTWHINRLEMLAVLRALKYFLPDLRDHHVLVRTDNTSVVAYINHQGGLRSRPLYRLAHQILVWAHGRLRSLRVVYIPGHLNMGADVLSRQGPRHGEWMLHPDVVKQIWRVFGQAQVDLFVTQETAQCPLWYSLVHPAPLGLDAMVQTWPRLRLYAFPPIGLLPGVLARVRRGEVSLLLVAPFWPGRVWFSDLISLLDGSPWEIPVRRDLLSQAGVFHPRPELWKLWVWPLRGCSS